MTKKERDLVGDAWAALNIAIAVQDTPAKEFPKGKSRTLQKQMMRAYTKLEKVVIEDNERRDAKRK